MSPPLTPEDFSGFFETIHGYPPFPWQLRLARQVCETGRWPAALDLPTGTGKTAVLDIAVFAMAMDAQRPAAKRQMPRRAILVVDRRTIVDQSHQRAQKVAGALRGAQGGILARVADALQALRARPLGLVPKALVAPPLMVAHLRGAVPRDDGWARDPSQPMIGVSTVDQVGSRLLFRGYGVSTGMRSVHAGLLGNDVVYFLDEVHLSRAFAATLAEVARLRDGASVHLRSMLDVVTMSATHGGSATDDGAPPFKLAAEDEAHPVLGRRLRATKPVALEAVDVAGNEAKRRRTLAERLADLANAAVASGARRIGVVVNRVDGALAVFDCLDSKRPDGAELTLLTGRMRAVDREHVETTALAKVNAGVGRRDDDPARIVVATQCIEAGADLDFDVLLTECASLDALVQRFGRLNRLGDITSARGTVVVRSDQIGDKASPDPIYGEALAATWAWLHAQSSLDFGIGGNVGSCDAPNVYPAPPTLLQLPPSYVDLWSQTRSETFVDVPVEPWLHGVKRASAEVNIVWRGDLAIENNLKGTSPRAAESVASLLEACPPLRTEAVTVPLWAAQAWLRGDAASVADVESDARGSESEERSAPATSRRVYRWRGFEQDLQILDDPARLAPGDTLIAASSMGGLRRYTFASDASELVPDRGTLAQLRQRHRLVLRPGLLAAWPGVPLADEPGDRWAKHLATALGELKAAVIQDIEETPAEALLRIEQLLATPPQGDAWMADVLKAHPGKLQLAAKQAVTNATDPLDLVLELPDTVDLKDIVGADAERTPQVSSEDDAASRVGRPVTLVDHLSHVAAHAQAFVETYNLPSALAQAVVVAAAWHDAGKADPRFQRWLVDGDEVAFTALGDRWLAKSRQVRGSRTQQQVARRRAGYPADARHELVSVAMLEQTPGVIPVDVDKDLVMHLVASHHGWCRPYAPVEAPGEHAPVAWSHQGHAFSTTTDHGLADVGATVVDRYWAVTQRYGWWGLAWLEALVRLADHRASRAEQAGHYAMGATK